MEIQRPWGPFLGSKPAGLVPTRRRARAPECRSYRDPRLRLETLLSLVGVILVDRDDRLDGPGRGT